MDPQQPQPMPGQVLVGPTAGVPGTAPLPPGMSSSAVAPAPVVGPPQGGPAPLAAPPRFDLDMGEIEKAAAELQIIHGKGGRGPSDFLSWVVGPNYVRFLPPWNEQAAAQSRWTKFATKHFRMPENTVQVCYEKTFPEYGFQCPICKILAFFEPWLGDQLKPSRQQSHCYANVVAFDYDKPARAFIPKRVKPYIAKLAIASLYQSLLELMAMPGIGSIVNIDNGWLMCIDRPLNFQGKNTYRATAVQRGPVFPDQNTINDCLRQVHDLDTAAGLGLPSAEKLQQQYQVAHDLLTALAQRVGCTVDALPGRPDLTPVIPQGLPASMGHPSAQVGTGAMPWDTMGASPGPAIPAGPPAMASLPAVAVPIPAVAVPIPAVAAPVPAVMAEPAIATHVVSPEVLRSGAPLAPLPTTAGPGMAAPVVTAPVLAAPLPPGMPSSAVVPAPMVTAPVAPPPGPAPIMGPPPVAAPVAPAPVQAAPVQAVEPAPGDCRCAVCGRDFKSARGVQTHMRRAHPDAPAPVAQPLAAPPQALAPAPAPQQAAPAAQPEARTCFGGYQQSNVVCVMCPQARACQQQAAGGSQ